MRARLPYAPPVFRTHRPPFGPVHSGPARSICYDPSESVLFAPPMMPLPRPGASHSFRPSFFSGHGPHARARRHPLAAAPSDTLHLASNGVRRSAAGAGRQTLQSTLSRYVVPRQTSDPRALCTPDPAETACVSRTSSRRGRPRSTRRTTPASSETYRLRRPPPRSERTRTARGPSPAFIPGRPPYRTFRPQSGRPSPRARPRRSAPPAEVSPR